MRESGRSLSAEPRGAGAFRGPGRVAAPYPARRMPLVIDTYNVTETTGVLPPELAGLDPEGLARLIASSRFANERVWLVCDGRPRSAARIGRIVVEGSGPGKTADERIAGILAADSAPRRMTVVSSDRAVVRNAKARGATVHSSAEFLGFLVDDWRKRRPRRAAPPDPRRSVPLSDAETAAWLRLFAVPEQLLAVDAAPALPTKPKSQRGATDAPPEAKPSAAPAPTGDAVLERFLERTRGLADPLSIFDSTAGDDLLAELAALDAATMDELMRRYEPSETKDGERIGGKRRAKRRPRK